MANNSENTANHIADELPESVLKKTLVGGPSNDSGVLVAVGAPHRREAFAACQYAIDTLKHNAPIWKKEHWADGSSSWVNIGDCERLDPPS